MEPQPLEGGEDEDGENPVGQHLAPSAPVVDGDPKHAINRLPPFGVVSPLELEGLVGPPGNFAGNTSLEHPIGDPDHLPLTQIS